MENQGVQQALCQLMEAGHLDLLVGGSVPAQSVQKESQASSRVAAAVLVCSLPRAWALGQEKALVSVGSTHEHMERPLKNQQVGAVHRTGH
ncbi:hypothetical protein NDU88_003219 [Pleurodeles waltl]|uniref:Uncharacterized protein n=1 Tax=Pleurodeles waltl TaxID=8319 RepID=A0AAV7W1H9_PLEWA|nr:hypothetical protein NDU88_003219 [Pleurodeles waltl]